FESAFQKRPEVFESVSVNLSARVALQVVDNLAVIIGCQIVVGHKRIGADSGTSLDVLPDVPAKLWPARCLNNVQNHPREFIALPALQNALNGCFLDSRVSN